MIWTLLVLLFYVLYRGGEYSVDLTTADKFQSSTRDRHYVDAFVFIAMGKMASDPMVDNAFSSVRRLGKWKGSIYVITDSPKCFENSVRDYDINVITAPSKDSIIEVKAMKPVLMDFMPSSVSSILYMDVDVLLMRNLVTFFGDFDEMLEQQHFQDSAATPITAFDFGAFLDAKGHYVGWCSNCEKWHTGVMWFKRNMGSQCLNTWKEILLSGRFKTDQESLDEAERSGACPNALHFPTRHLLFAKDYIAMMLTAGQSFVHLTAAGRLEDSDYFYREFVIPNLRKASGNAHSPTARKEC